MDVQLRVLAGGNAGQTVKVVGPKFYIGRSADCQLRAKSDAISRYHCVLVIEDQTLVIGDLGSRNGTYVNGERLAGETRRLQAGDFLKIGPLEFEVLITCDGGPDRSRLAGDTGRLNADETDPGVGPTAGAFEQPGETDTKADGPASDEAAADALRRLRRFRRI